MPAWYKNFTMCFIIIIAIIIGLVACNHIKVHCKKPTCVIVNTADLASWQKHSTSTDKVSSETKHKVKCPHEKKKTEDSHQAGSASADVMPVL